MAEVFINGDAVSKDQGRTHAIRRALMSGMDKDEMEALYERAFLDSIDGAEARDTLLDEGLEIVIGDD